MPTTGYPEPGPHDPRRRPGSQHQRNARLLPGRAQHLRRMRGLHLLRARSRCGKPRNRAAVGSLRQPDQRRRAGAGRTPAPAGREPAFNGGAAARRYFGAFKRKSDGVHYISQTYDESKWAVAAAAAKRVIDLGIYRLHTVPADEYTLPLPSNVPPIPSQRVRAASTPSVPTRKCSPAKRRT